MRPKQVIKSVISKSAFLLPFRATKSAQQARVALQTYQPCPMGTFAGENIVNLQYDLQIIIPAYNVEKYIRECMESVISQVTHYRYLVTVVNDGSTDRTGDILAEYAGNGNNACDIEVITQKNRGLSAARNTCLKTIHGKYLMLLDSDDVIPQATIENMLNMAEKTNADILQGSWYSFDADRRKNHILKEEGVLSDNRGIVSGFAWGKLYKYTVMENFRFPEGYWFEDTPISFMIAAMPFRFVATKRLVYGYRLNPQGITQTAGKRRKSVDSYWITELCLREFPSFGLAYDQRAYEYLLRQALVNWSRTNQQPLEVREAIFVLTRELREQYFSGYHTEISKLRKLERAIEKRQFRKFEFLAWCYRGA